MYRKREEHNEISNFHRKMRDLKSVLSVYPNRSKFSWVISLVPVLTRLERGRIHDRADSSTGNGRDE